MTYFYELGQVMTRDPELRSASLVFRNTRVPVEALLDDLQRGCTAEEFLAGHPSVFPEHVGSVVMCWEDLVRDAESLEAARQRLLAHADWALISERVARRIDAQAGDAREPPNLETLAAWAEDVARELGGGSGTQEVEQGTADRPGEARPSPGDESGRLADAILTLSDAVSALRTAGEERAVLLCRLARELGEMVDYLQSDEAARAVDELFGAEAEDGVTEVLHALTDAASNLRTAAGALEGRRPVHATHARRLAEDVDRLITDLRQTAES